MRMADLVSIIITTKDEADVIGDLLDSIRKQTYKKIEIILVDNKSSDQTLEIAKKYKTRIYSFGPERSAQRNYGARKSKGKYLLFLDADMKLTPKVVKACMKKIKSEKKVGGIEIPEESIAYSFWERVKAFERSFYNEKGDPITDAARFFPSEVFERVGGYDETITGPEDWDLPETIREMGFSMKRINEKIYHRERVTSLLILFKKKFYYGLYVHKYLDKHKIPIVSPKTVYFLRPLFYRSWGKLISNPLLSLGMITMLLIETVGGGSGYLIGRFKPNESITNKR